MTTQYRHCEECNDAAIQPKQKSAKPQNQTY